MQPATGRFPIFTLYRNSDVTGASHVISRAAIDALAPLPSRSAGNILSSDEPTTNNFMIHGQSTFLTGSILFMLELIFKVS